jgi:IS605 OrfB family transposase
MVHCFKGRNCFKSMEYTYGDGCKLLQDSHGRRSFYLQNVGEMKMCFHRGLPQGSKIKHAIVKRVNDCWYICLMLEMPDTSEDHVPTGRQVGIDVGLKSFAALSSGELIENPRWMRNSLARLRILQRHVSRQIKGSNRQRKTYRQIARLHEQIANQRADYLHQVSWLVTENDLVAIEDLTLGFMNQNRHLSLSSHDAGFGLFRQMLEYKAESAGVQVVAVNPFNTSQVCVRSFVTGIQKVQIMPEDEGIHKWLKDHMMPEDTPYRLIWQDGLDWKKALEEIYINPSKHLPENERDHDLLNKIGWKRVANVWKLILKYNAERFEDNPKAIYSPLPHQKGFNIGLWRSNTPPEILTVISKNKILNKMPDDEFIVIGRVRWHYEIDKSRPKLTNNDITAIDGKY